MSTFDPAKQPHDPKPDLNDSRQARRTQAAVENVREGYGKSAKAGIISGKPDTPQGGPGRNNDDAQPPASKERQ